MRPFGEPTGPEVASRYYDSVGNTFDYVYELAGDTLTIWAGAKDGPAYYRGTFDTDGTTVTGEWVYPGGGGYASTMTRIRKTGRTRGEQTFLPGKSPVPGVRRHCVSARMGAFGSGADGFRRSQPGVRPWGGSLPGRSVRCRCRRSSRHLSGRVGCGDGPAPGCGPEFCADKELRDGGCGGHSVGLCWNQVATAPE